MQAIRAQKYGGPEVLQLETIPIPVPKRNQVLIQVKAVGVNPVDVSVRSGGWKAALAAYGGAPALEFPYTPGIDAAGIIAVVGADVKNFDVGDRVFAWAFEEGGAYAQYMAVSADVVFRLPGYLTYSQGAALGVPYFTALKALLLQSRARKGETLLVHGASGGTGIATLQLGKHLGMDVVGTAGTEEGLKLVKANGARLALNHKDANHKQNLKDSTGGKGFDVIVEMAANVNLALDLEVAKFAGRVVLVGSRGHGSIAEFNPWPIIAKDLSVIGDASWGTTEAERRDMAKELAKAMEGSVASPSPINPAISEELPLAKASQAHVEIMTHSNGSNGKIILIP